MCGTRLIHSTPGKEVVSVKGGCIEGLDWSKARHIWCKRASKLPIFFSMIFVPWWTGCKEDDEMRLEVPGRGLG